jgi:hypothetical protein
LLDHRGVVGGFKRRRRDQQPDPGLVEYILQFTGPVRRVDVDQDCTDLRGGVLGEQPLRAVRRPDPDPVPLADPGSQQPVRQRVDFRSQLRIRPSTLACAINERIAVWP